jgi:hypothetical protein
MKTTEFAVREPFDRAAVTAPDQYRAQIGTTFLVAPADDPVPLRLAEVSAERVSNGFAQFSLFFHGPPSRLLPQHIYTLHHDVLGSLALFIVPIVGSNAERIVYEACFTRRVGPDATAASGEGVR